MEQGFPTRRIAMEKITERLLQVRKPRALQCCNC